MTAAALAVVLLSSAATANEGSLIRITRSLGIDRNALINTGVALVAETEDAFLAVGAPSEVIPALASRSIEATTVASVTDHARFALAGLRPGFSETDLLVCGEVIARGIDWLLLQETDFDVLECRESGGWFLSVLDMDHLVPIKAPPPIDHRRLTADPLIQEMVARVDTALALSHWSTLAESNRWTTRHSSSQGCIDATAYVHDLFTVLGLETSYQHHTDGYADNVIGTLPGLAEPESVYIAIGHLDDLPSSGPAPGADDNASGAAMVTALAEIMSGYCFARTSKFIAVTGEEQGLDGSDYYADTAFATGEDIQAVLNGDMIGWEGNGQPSVEDLDVNYNAGSQWLAQAMVDAAAIYDTGLAINAFPCATMVYSDHAPFWSKGYSAICGITDNEGFCSQSGNYPYYHQSSDTIVNCGPGAPDFEAAAIRAYLATMAHLVQPIARVPDSPGSISAQPDGANRIALTWSYQDPGAVTRIYRTTGGCADSGPSTLVGETESTHFIDTTVSGGVPYAYRLTTTVAGSCVSQLSSCVESTTIGACNEPPSFVGIGSAASAASSSCQINLNWQPPDTVWCGGPVGYNIYRSNAAGFTPSRLNRVAEMITATSYQDTDVYFSERYHYIVRSVDLAHSAEDGNLHEIASSPTGPNAMGTWHDDAGDTRPAELRPTNPWMVVAGGGLNASAAYSTGVYGNNLCAALTTPELEFGVNPQLEFWSTHDIENDWDKGELQISVDGGTSWQRVPMVYPGSSTHTNDQCNFGTGRFFTGHAPAYSVFSADLSPWQGQPSSLRWVLSSDISVVGDGWWIDEISVSDVSVPGSCVDNRFIFSDGFEAGDSSAWSE